MISLVLCILLFLSLCGGLLLGYPVAFTMAGVSIFWGLVANYLGVMDISIFGAIPTRIYGSAITNTVLLAVPLFIFMGVMLEKSKVAEELLKTMGEAFGAIRGGVGYSVMIVGTLLAASTGIVGATVITMGLLSLPTMMKYKYDNAYSCGTICAAGTLGQIIPPSIVLVILGDQLSNSYVLAQRQLGNFSPQPVSIGDLFAAALIPGLILVGMYIVYQIGVAIFYPEKVPIFDTKHKISLRKLLPRLLHAVMPPLTLIIAVLGSILLGFASPTESAGVGAVGALILAAIRITEDGMTPAPSKNLLVRGIDIMVMLFIKRRNLHFYAGIASLLILIFAANYFDLAVDSFGSTVLFSVSVFLTFYLLFVISLALWTVYRVKILHSVAKETTKITVMVFSILIGATILSLVLRGLGGDEIIRNFLLSLPGGFFTQMLVVMVVIFFLGFVIDFIEITLIVVPIVAPILLISGVSPVWLGIMIAMNLQTSFLTPPFGFSLFYLRGCAPKSIRTTDIYRGVIPFVLIQLLMLCILAYFPQLANWLPGIIFNSHW